MEISSLFHSEMKTGVGVLVKANVQTDILALV